MVRVAAFIDGFNLYHAIDDLGAHYLKWVNLRRLCAQFAPAPQYSLIQVNYFSAYATWQPDRYKRHREFVRASKLAGVTPIMGRFKEKDVKCRKCGVVGKHHEEKETDVNIAIHLLRGAYRDEFDRALLVSADSDLVPAVKVFRQEFSAKQLMLVVPVGRNYSMALVHAAGGKSYCRRMEEIHVERCLMPREIRDPSGRVAVTRPGKYQPPSGIRPASFP